MCQADPTSPSAPSCHHRSQDPLFRFPVGFSGNSGFRRSPRAALSREEIKMQNPWDKEFLEPLWHAEGTTLPSQPRTPQGLHAPVAPSAPSPAARGFGMQSNPKPGCFYPLGGPELLGICSLSDPWRGFVLSWGWGSGRFQPVAAPRASLSPGS